MSRASRLCSSRLLRVMVGFIHVFLHLVILKDENDTTSFKKKSLKGSFSWPIGKSNLRPFCEAVGSVDSVSKSLISPIANHNDYSLLQ